MPTPDDFQRLSSFLQRLRGDVYEEPLEEPHRGITLTAMQTLRERGALAAGMRVLDIGCGQGFALELFAEAGADPLGITLGADYRVCVEKGLPVREMDLSFLDFADAEFDLIWCRHSLEHSVFPLFTLSEMSRVIRSGGALYVEVPAPDMTAQHERNPNHYSVLGRAMWLSLFEKAGLSTQETFEIKFDTPIGRDVYWGFLLRKGETARSP
jgi:SAM-dependent methyltransferase